MAYVTYTTTALVCGTFNRNTADRSCLLFTKDAGMLYADARSVREERSRQRYALQDFSHVRVSLVKGKRGWRVGSIQSLENHYHAAPDKAARGSVVSLYRLLRRFLKGEEAAPALFEYVAASLSELLREQPQRQFVELVIAVRVLAQLGYVDIRTLPAEVQTISPGDIARNYSQSAAQQIEKIYSQAVTVSHL